MNRVVPQEFTGERAEYLALLNKKIDEEREIIEDAKRKGIWKEGLDVNRELFKKLDEEFKHEIDKLKQKRQ